METRTYERGRFYIGPNGFPRFAGSASGVYLADTIQSEVSPSAGIPLRLEGEDDSNVNIGEAFVDRNNADAPRSEEALFYGQYLLKVSDLRHEALLRDRLHNYFTLWHPLFPFLDGAYLLQCYENAVAIAALNQSFGLPVQGSSTDGGNAQPSVPAMQAFVGLKEEEALVLTAIFLAVFTIGGLDHPPDRSLPLLRSTSQTTMIAHLIIGACQNSRVNDFFAIQGLIALQLYLYATRTLRPAMHLSGTIIKLAYEAGLHRCPERFTSTFKEPQDREMRKRVFYSLYVLDRLLSAEFGIPLMLNDSDIDVCVPGNEEVHGDSDSPHNHPARSPVDASTTPARLANLKRPREEQDVTGTPSSSSMPSKSRKTLRPDDQMSAGEASRNQAREQQATNADPSRLKCSNAMVRIAQMIGYAMERFNKSVPNRSIDAEEALSLRTSLDSWWNDVGLDYETETENAQSQYSTLFTCLYHQQIINLSRPSLSLSPDSIQHAHALQTSIASARVICATLAKALNGEDSGRFWPGYVDMVFFSTLILVYGVKRERSSSGLLRSYERLQVDLKRALGVLERLSLRWKHFRSFISIVQTFINRISLEKSAPNRRESTINTAQNYPQNQQPGTTGSGDNIASTSNQESQPIGQTFNPQQTESSTTSNTNQQFSQIDQLFGELTGNDFMFDFSTFELNPDTSWAFHASVPGSPII